MRCITTLCALIGFLLTVEVLVLPIVLLTLGRLALLVWPGFWRRRLLLMLMLSMRLLGGGRRSTFSQGLLPFVTFLVVQSLGVGELLLREVHFLGSRDCRYS